MLNEMLALYALSHYTVNDGGVVGDCGGVALTRWSRSTKLLYGGPG